MRRSKLTHWSRRETLLSFYSTVIAVFRIKVSEVKVFFSSNRFIVIVPNVGKRIRERTPAVTGQLCPGRIWIGC